MRLTRRQLFLLTGIALGGPELLPAAARAERRPPPPVPPAPEGDALFERSLVFDALSVDEEWGEEAWQAARRSGLTAFHTSLANRSLEVALRDLALWQARFDRSPERLLKVLRGRDVVEAKRSGRLGVLLGFQNATVIGSEVDNLKILHALGARCIQLTYNSRNLLGDGCTERTNAGLSDFGLAVVERMNELRMVVDLSHCGEQTARDAIERSRHPPAFTHTMCRALHDHVRAKSDELLRAIAERGGVTGIVSLGYFVGPSPETGLEDYLRHLDHAVRVAGIEHVGLASDYSIRGIAATATREAWYLPRLEAFKPSYNVRWPPWIEELDPPERFRTIAHALGKRGFKSGDVEKVLGGNWVRYLSAVLGD